MLGLLLRGRIKGIAQAIADDVEAEHDNRNQQADVTPLRSTFTICLLFR